MAKKVERCVVAPTDTGSMHVSKVCSMSRKRLDPHEIHLGAPPLPPPALGCSAVPPLSPLALRGSRGARVVGGVPPEEKLFSAREVRGTSRGGEEDEERTEEER